MWVRYIGDFYILEYVICHRHYDKAENWTCIVVLVWHLLWMWIYFYNGYTFIVMCIIACYPPVKKWSWSRGLSFLWMWTSCDVLVTNRIQWQKWTCIPVADSFWCLAKLIQCLRFKNKIKLKNLKKKWSYFAFQWYLHELEYLFFKPFV